ncbi:hypothetical protein EV421DRAFT_1972095 [Armillaria borealis]|uniref:Uncharacterized protein n=1 Tax=Armillaria borealis TaxID=47425 RepID=A0AA39J9N1_9AGAR|nr:hypothetical protein EV421DRAFT_1972095 [Armillaria borealis]
MANERGHQIVFIRKVEIMTITSTEKSKFCLKITASNKKQKTEEIKFNRASAMPKWTINMDLGNLDPQTVVSWKLYDRRRLCLKVLGSVEKTLEELFEGSSTSADIHLFNGTSEIAVLKISGSNSAKTLMDKLVPSIKKPSENYKFLESSETLEKVFDAAKGMVDILTGVGNILQFDLYCLTNLFPRCTLQLPVAWGLLSIGFTILKNQHDTKQAVLDLYAEMISAYEAFSKDEILEQHVQLQGTYSSLFKQTIKCAMFIEGYAKKTGIECLFTMDVLGNAENFRLAFIDLKNQLSLGFAKEAVIVTLGVQQLVSGVWELVISVQERVDLQSVSFFSCNPV